MKSLFTWTERRLLRLFRKLSTRQNLHLKAEMFSFHSKYFVYRELKRAPQKLSFCFKCPDTGQHTVFAYCRELNKCMGLKRNLTHFRITEPCNCLKNPLRSWLAHMSFQLKVNGFGLPANCGSRRRHIEIRVDPGDEFPLGTVTLELLPNSWSHFAENYSRNKQTGFRF